MGKLKHRNNIGRKTELTCIVGIAENGTVFMGGDSAGVAGNDITIRKDGKVFRLDNRFLIGFTSSFRMGQVLRYKLEVPEQKENQSDFEFMVTSFIDSVRNTFKENSCEEGHFLVGYKGVLYTIESDFQVGIPANQYDSVGCGEQYALGNLYGSNGEKAPSRILKALKAAEHFSTGVSCPFNIMSLESVDSNQLEEDVLLH